MQASAATAAAVAEAVAMAASASRFLVGGKQRFTGRE